VLKKFLAASVKKKKLEKLIYKLEKEIRRVNLFVCGVSLEMRFQGPGFQMVVGQNFFLFLTVLYQE
jgi:hypothetical protein